MMKKTSKIMLWILGLALLAFLIYCAVSISLATAAVDAKRAATRGAMQTAYAAGAYQKTQLARTPTLVPLTDLAQACLQGGGAPVAIKGIIKPAFIVQTAADTRQKGRMRFTDGSFYLRQEQAEMSTASLGNIKMCSAGWLNNCVYMLRNTNNIYDPTSLNGITAEGVSFSYKDPVTVTGTITFLNTDKYGFVHCRIHVDSLH
jgi:hypothetical protein